MRGGVQSPKSEVQGQKSTTLGLHFFHLELWTLDFGLLS